MSRDGVSCYRVEADGIVVDVRLTPKTARDTIDGIGEWADGRSVVRARVRATPERGAANDALVRLFAKQFHVPKSAVAVVAGAGHRLKQVKVSGEPAALVMLVRSWPRRT